jgi:hypothetical protein
MQFPGSGDNNRIAVAFTDFAGPFIVVLLLFLRSKTKPILESLEAPVSMADIIAI